MTLQQKTAGRLLTNQSPTHEYGDDSNLVADGDMIDDDALSDKQPSRSEDDLHSEGHQIEPEQENIVQIMSNTNVINLVPATNTHQYTSWVRSVVNHNFKKKKILNVIGQERY